MAPASTDEDASEPTMNLVNEEEEEGESCWIPLVEEEETTGNSARWQQRQTHVALPPPDSTTPSRPNPPPPTTTTSRRHQQSSSSSSSLQAISDRLDARIRLKQNLVDHPLDRAWRLFLQYFGNEIWQLDLYLRLGIVLVVVGSILTTLTWTLSFRWLNVRTIVLLFVFGTSFYYVAPPDVEQKLQYFVRLLVNPNKALELADYANPQIMRRLFVGLLLLPTVLEMRTFGFLSEAMVDSATIMSNVSVGIVLGIFLTYRFKIQQATPRQCIQQCIVVLYGFALFFCLRRVDVYRLPALMGPFLLSTGTLLLSYRDEDMNWLSRALRHALRLTLRDILASVGDSVREDEMLQLAMLRWIVDYWSYQPPPPASRRPSSASSTTESQSSSSAIVPARQQDIEVHRDLQWEELQPMLDMTTDQMVEEVPGHQAAAADDGSFSGDQSTSSRRSSSFHEELPHHRQDNDSLRNLQNMLTALDVDNRARPAVMAYKRVVESFPPTRNHAVFLSIIRRCPALLMLLYRYLTGSDWALVSTATLLPFAIMEAFRVLHWAEACQRALESTSSTPSQSGELPTRQSQNTLISVPAEMDPMCILLSGDCYLPTFPPPLLQVWINICSSVRALEMGLTATRCVQTTVVAADFAANIISLAQFGMEVSQHGWLHGVTVMARELMHLHTTQSAENAKYASAAVNAVRTGSIVARNVQLLAEEGEGGNPVIDPIVGVLAAIVGRGWLWGKEEESRQQSTVTIEELPSDEASADPRDDIPIEGMEPIEKQPQESIAVSTRESLAVESQAPVSSAVAVESQADHTKPLPAEDDGSQTNELESSNDHSWAPQKLAASGDGPTQDLSGLMQLIADAFEQGLIEESEKNAFMETLLVSGTDSNGKPNIDTIEQMERSLRALLESSHSEAVACDSQENEPCIFPEEGDAGEPVSTACAMDDPMKEDSPDSDEWRPLSHQPQESIERVTDSSSAEHSNVAMITTDASIGTPNDRPLVDTSQQQEKEGDDWAKWVGGGIAVLGAVAGGIAIANASQRDDNRNSQLDSTTNRSTVLDVKERPGDEEDSDEWVAVSSDNDS